MVEWDDLELSQALRDGFSAWIRKYDYALTDEEFDFEGHFAMGLALAERLKDELPPLFYLEYEYIGEYTVIER